MFIMKMNLSCKEILYAMERNITPPSTITEHKITEKKEKKGQSGEEAEDESRGVLKKPLLSKDLMIKKT